MERFCDKCGTLVNGDGMFCPNCGAPLASAVDLGKPASDPVPGSNPVQPAPVNNTYSGGSPYNQQPVYPQNYNNAGIQPEVQNMTVGQWVLTVFLGSLGIIGLVLLFVWAFDSNTMQPKKNYARAMLIWQAIALGVVILFYGAMFACVGGLAGGFDELFDTYYAMLLMR